MLLDVLLLSAELLSLPLKQFNIPKLPKIFNAIMFPRALWLLQLLVLSIITNDIVVLIYLVGGTPDYSIELTSAQVTLGSYTEPLLSLPQSKVYPC